jgi:DNA-binding beta-propeller fold protein YncE
VSNRDLGAAGPVSAGRRGRAAVLAGVLAVTSLSLGAGLSTAAGSPASLKQPKVTVISVPAGANGVALDSTTHTLWVSGDDEMSMVNTKTHAVTTVSTPNRSGGLVAVDQTNDMVLVTNYANGSVTVLNGRTHKVTHTVKVGVVAGIAVLPALHRAYLPDTTTNRVIVMNTKSGKIVRRIRVKNGPNGVAVNPKTRTVYVSFQGVLNSNSFWYHGGLAVISGRHDKVTHLVKPPYTDDLDQPYGVAVDESKNVVYLLNNASTNSDVFRISGKTNKVTSTDVGNVAYPNGMITFSPKTKLLYIDWVNNTEDTAGVDLVRPGQGGPPVSVGVPSASQLAPDSSSSVVYVAATPYVAGDFEPGLEVIHGS